jgi:predicted acetyltransferase
MTVEVRLATAADRPTIERLIQLYLYDMASEHPWPLEPDGRYAYDFLDRFWQHPYLLYSSGELAGFALVIRGCPITGREDCWFMAEFFVLRSYRRHGLGGEAVRELLTQHAGSWHVATLLSNQPALAFWSRALADYGLAVNGVAFDGDNWRVHAFDA